MTHYSEDYKIFAKEAIDDGDLIKAVEIMLNQVKKKRLSSIDKIEEILHLIGCQQRAAGYSEALAGKEINIEDTERLEAVALAEVKQILKGRL